MDNPPADLTPDPETLARLLELRNRYGLSTAADLERRAEMPAERLEGVGWYLDPNWRRARRQLA